MASSSSLETNAVRSRFQYSANEYNSSSGSSSSSSSTANYAPCSTSTQPITKPMPPYAPPDLNELASTPLSQPHQLLDDNSGMSPAQSVLNTAPNTGQPLTAVATSVANSFSSLSPQQQAPTSFQYTNNNYANNTSNSYNNNINKPASAHSIGATSFNHASSSPSPTYPSANSWPGFMAKNPVTDDSRLASFSCCSEPTKSSFAQHQQQPEQSVNGFKSFQRKSVDRVFVFNSKMANEAIGGVQENKYESIVAWHEANCQPSTSTAPQQNQFILNDSQPQQQPQPIKTKRKSNVKEFQQEMRLRSPSSTNGIAPPPPVSGMRMERMTQDSLFEPPSKVIRTTSNENSHPARRFSLSFILYFV
ncbi:unnamed protein product [Anisakis simplex]|uniref:Uncharacterized protein n=1 Tax=Anisakis simplex TaxID=6269 RepID=A0A0M3K7H6_ANISI|nr:unnamed protein product [Anisakis simplex]